MRSNSALLFKCQSKNKKIKNPQFSKQRPSTKQNSQHQNAPTVEFPPVPSAIRSDEFCPRPCRTRRNIRHSRARKPYPARPKTDRDALIHIRSRRRAGSDSERAGANNNQAGPNFRERDPASRDGIRRHGWRSDGRPSRPSNPDTAGPDADRLAIYDLSSGRGERAERDGLAAEDDDAGADFGEGYSCGGEDLGWSCWVGILWLEDGCAAVADAVGANRVRLSVDGHGCWVCGGSYGECLGAEEEGGADLCEGYVGECCDLCWGRSWIASGLKSSASYADAVWPDRDCLPKNDCFSWKRSRPDVVR